MRFTLVLVLFALNSGWSFSGRAQGSGQDMMLWPSIQQDLALRNDLVVQLQLHHRWISGGSHQWIAPRLNGEFVCNDHFSLSAGISYFGVGRVDGDNQVQLQTEIRPHQGVTVQFDLGNALFSQRLLLEERAFVASKSEVEEAFFLRFRYRWLWLIEMWSREDSSIHFKWFDEVMFNTAHSRTRRAFDQNRIFAGIAYKFNQQLTMDLGFMYWIQQPIGFGENIQFNIIRLGIVHALSLNSK